MSLLAIGAGLGSALLGSSSAKSAQRAQEQAAQAQIMLEGNIFQATSKKFQPFLNSGNRAQQALDYEMGLGELPTFGATAPKIVEFTDTPAPTAAPANALAFPGADPYSRGQGGIGGGAVTQQEPLTKYRVNGEVFNTHEAAKQYANANKTGGTEYRGFQATPGYDFRVSEAMDAVEGSAAAGGTLNSGATLKALQQRGNALANQEYDNYLNRLTNQAQAGQAAAGNFATAGANFAAGGSNALANIGNAGAAGAIGQSNALMNGINTGLGIWNYQNQRAANTNNSGGGIFGGLFG